MFFNKPVKKVLREGTQYLFIFQGHNGLHLGGF